MPTWLADLKANRTEMKKRHGVALEDEERRSLRELVPSGNGAARQMIHVGI